MAEATKLPEKFDHHECLLCHNYVKIVRVETTDLKGNKSSTEVAKCPICDVRKCKKGHFIQDMKAGRCPECKEVL